MSFLLDALRKSEAQRRLGETPTLGMSVPPAAPARGGSRRWLLLVIVLLGVGLASFLVWQEIFELGSAPAPVAQAPEPPVVEPVREPPPEVVMPETAPEIADDPPTETSPVDRDTEVADATQRRRAALERRRAALEAETPAEPAEPEVPPVPDDEVDTAIPEVVEADPPEPASEPPPESDRIHADRREYLHQWELPAAIRNELPPLNIMAHIYADDADNRFILMNGRRYVEGDELGDGVTLAEIRREGAVVDFREYRFLVE